MGLDYIGRCTECGGIISAATEEHVLRHPEILGDICPSDSGIERMKTEDIRKARWGHSPGCDMKPEPAQEQGNLFEEQGT